MTGRRYAHSRATVATGGSISERTPCADRWDVYDALTETGRPDNYDDLVQAAKNMCATCILRTPDVARACLERNKGERWRDAVLGKRRSHNPNVEATPSQRLNRRGLAEFNATRLADLRHFVAAGAGVDEVTAALGITRSGLWKWCDRHGAQAEWQAISDPGNGNQYQRRDDIGQITTRRRGKASAA